MIASPPNKGPTTPENALPPKLSVVVITKNEGLRIGACLKSVPFAHEWVVLDSGSHDNTVAEAEACGAQVHQRTDWPGFGAQKNRALDLAQGDWVLSLDADEQLSPELAAAIQAAVASNGEQGAVDAYDFNRRSSFCGQWVRHGDWYPDRVLRLFRRGSARFSDDLVHERLLVKGRVKRLPGLLMHDSIPDLESALAKLNSYTTGRAVDQHRAGKRSGGLTPALLRGFWAFFRCYVLRLGFLDGGVGVALAIYSSQLTYYRYLKLGHLQKAPHGLGVRARE